MLPLLALILTLLYPLLIWIGHERIEPRWLALLLLVTAATRLPGLALSQAARWSIAGALLLAGVTIWANVLLPLKLYPVLVSFVLLGIFAYSLIVPPSVVERLARLREPDLPPAAVAYTRRVTQVWCGFFILNGSIAFATAWCASHAVWSLYTGVIAYVLMGILFGVEYLLRLRFKRLHHG